MLRWTGGSMSRTLDQANRPFLHPAAIDPPSLSMSNPQQCSPPHGATVASEHLRLLRQARGGPTYLSGKAKRKRQRECNGEEDDDGMAVGQGPGADISSLSIGLRQVRRMRHQQRQSLPDTIAQQHSQGEARRTPTTRKSTVHTVNADPNTCDVNLLRMSSSDSRRDAHQSPSLFCHFQEEPTDFELEASSVEEEDRSIFFFVQERERKGPRPFQFDSLDTVPFEWEDESDEDAAFVFDERSFW